MRSKTVITANLRGAEKAARQLLDMAEAQRSKPSVLRAGPLGLYSGCSGVGKTCAFSFVQDRLAAEGVEVCFLRWDQLSTPSGMLSDWLGALGCSSEGTVRAKYESLVRHLSDRRALTFWDEADYAVQFAGAHPLLNIVRDVCDRAAHPVLFASVNRLRQRLARPSNFTSQISSRIIVEVEFGPLSLSDARLFAADLVEGVELSRDLVAVLLQLSGGSTRRLLGIYQQVERAAAAANIHGAFGTAQAIRLGLVDAPSAPKQLEDGEERRPADVRARVA